MKKKNPVVITLCIVAAVLLLWFAAGFTDYAMAESGKAPVFCIEQKDGVYVGLGYSYEMYPHLITGKNEYALYLFGNLIKSNFTN